MALEDEALGTDDDGGGEVTLRYGIGSGSGCGSGGGRGNGASLAAVRVQCGLQYKCTVI